MSDGLLLDEDFVKELHHSSLLFNNISTSNNKSQVIKEYSERDLGLMRIEGIGTDKVMKRCQVCNCLLSLDKFNKNCCYDDGYYVMCKSCRFKCRNKYESFSISNSVIRSKLTLQVAKHLRADTDIRNECIDIVGCSQAELKRYFASLFTEGMTFSNHGRNGWHIDHIVPSSVFDLRDSVERKQCFHYTNLQPLWAKDNMVKGDMWVI